MGNFGSAFRGPSGITTGWVDVIIGAVAAIPELSLDDCRLGVGLLGGTRADLPNVSVAFWSCADGATVELSGEDCLLCLLSTGRIGVD